VSKFSLKSFWWLGVLACILIYQPLTHADDGGRKIKSKVAPQYPELAKKMNVSGAVKLEVIIGANGQVKSVKALGGHPLLIDAAENAVRQWRFESGPEGTEVIEVRFDNPGN